MTTNYKKAIILFVLLFALFFPLICSNKYNSKVNILKEKIPDKQIKETKKSIRTWKQLNKELEIKIDIELAATAIPTPVPVTDTPTPTPHEHWYDGWTSNTVNVRTEPNTDCDIFEKYPFNTYIYFTEENEEWVKIQYGKQFAYIHKDYVSLERKDYVEYAIPKYSGQKSWMSWKTITLTTSKQYKLQKEYAYTGAYGIRMVNGRYCIAVGSHFKTEIGQYIDLVLENGTIIECVMGDQKADKDTDSQHIFTAGGCCSEFIIDRNLLNSAAKISGNMSSIQEFNSPVKYIRVYDKNAFDNE